MTPFITEEMARMGLDDAIAQAGGCGNVAQALEEAGKRLGLPGGTFMSHGPAMGHPYDPFPGVEISPTPTPFNQRKGHPLPKLTHPDATVQKHLDVLNLTVPTNPKQLYGDKKPPVHLIHQIAELHESAALHSGKRKYGENNYIQTEVEAMTYVGAMLRHIKAWVSGERVDPKELVHHLGAVKACATILLTCEATGMLIDNRPMTPVGDRFEIAPVSYKTATEATLKEVEATIEHLNKLYPELL
jgi:hypothetical protein